MGKVFIFYIMYVKIENFYFMLLLNNRGKDVGIVIYCILIGIMKYVYRM